MGLGLDGDWPREEAIAAARLKGCFWQEVFHCSLEIRRVESIFIELLFQLKCSGSQPFCSWYLSQKRLSPEEKRLCWRLAI